MSEIVKEWLKELYEGEIKEAEGTIANERMWEKGAPDEATQAIHTENIRLQEEYIEALNEKLSDLDDGKEG